MLLTAHFIPRSFATYSSHSERIRHSLRFDCASSSSHPDLNGLDAHKVSGGRNVREINNTPKSGIWRSQASSRPVGRSRDERNAQPAPDGCTIGRVMKSLARAVKMLRAFCVQNRDFWSRDRMRNWVCSNGVLALESRTTGT